MPAPLTDEWIEEQLAICKMDSDWREAHGTPPFPSPQSFSVFRQFLTASQDGYALALKEIQRLKDVVYGAFEDLRQGESGHAAKTLDDNRKPGTKSYYE